MFNIFLFISTKKKEKQKKRKKKKFHQNGREMAPRSRQCINVFYYYVPFTHSKNNNSIAQKRASKPRKKFKAKKYIGITNECSEKSEKRKDDEGGSKWVRLHASFCVHIYYHKKRIWVKRKRGKKHSAVPVSVCVRFEREIQGHAAVDLIHISLPHFFVFVTAHACIL